MDTSNSANSADKQRYEIILSPDLGISPKAFADAWNENGETSELSQAQLSKSSGNAYSIFIIAILITVGTGVATGVISDRINKLLDKHANHPDKHMHMEYKKENDGTISIVIDTDE